LDGKKINLTNLAWSRICSPKWIGDLGIRSMISQNMALLAKLEWRILRNDDAPWITCLKQKYLSNTDLLNASSSPQASWLLKGIINNNQLVRKGACYMVGNGELINIWNDP
jgi:hypothetical protein